LGRDGVFWKVRIDQFVGGTRLGAL